MKREEILFKKFDFPTFGAYKHLNSLLPSLNTPSANTFLGTVTQAASESVAVYEMG